MKTKTLIIITILAVLLSAAFTFAQDMVAAVQMEYTVAGPQWGGLVNDKFLVVVPGLETRINMGKRTVRVWENLLAL